MAGSDGLWKFFIFAGRARHLLSSKADNGARFFKNIVGLFILFFYAGENILTCTACTSVWGYFLKERKEIEKRLIFVKWIIGEYSIDLVGMKNL